jgi:uncharacterized protein (DUF924 family)
MQHYIEVYNFWFNTLTPKDWYRKSDKLDKLIKDKFQKIHTMATKNELARWRRSPKGTLSEVIVLDQFSRNIYRDQAQAFQSDSQALCLAQNAIEKGLHNHLNLQERMFLYMPFMHSESQSIHDKAVEIFQEPGLEDSLDYEQKHFDIIKKFGRYPHRNIILKRDSTQEEITFLKQPGSSF